VRLCVWGGLALCAAVVAALRGVAPRELAPGLDRALLAAALGLALASILARQLAGARRTGLRVRVWLELASLLLAGGIGLVGVAAVELGADTTRGLLHVFAGALFALRPAAPPGARPRA
jgi:hypothetical protein